MPPFQPEPYSSVKDNATYAFLASHLGRDFMSHALQLIHYIYQAGFNDGAFYMHHLEDDV